MGGFEKELCLGSDKAKLLEWSKIEEVVKMADEETEGLYCCGWSWC